MTRKLSQGHQSSRQGENFQFELFASLILPLVPKYFIEIDDFDFVCSKTGTMKKS